MFLTSFVRPLASRLCTTLTPSALRAYSSVKQIKAYPISLTNSFSANKHFYQTFSVCYPEHTAEDGKPKNDPISKFKFPLECCGNPCPDVWPRFDCLYYKPSDKVKRQYHPTWVDCVPITKCPRKICCHDPNKLPPIKRRKRGELPATACGFSSRARKPECSLNENKKCLKFFMPYCPRSRATVSCKIFKKPSNCQKSCCPYPSFSECTCSWPKALRGKECSCLAKPPQCEVVRYLKRKLIFDLPPPLPAWPPKLCRAR